MKRLIVIAGPTASGKTSLAIRIAQHYNTEIVSADSRQCYKELNIGVARPTEEELASVRHHFIASHSIHDQISAGTYEQLALAYCNTIFETNDTAVLVGGTGLYIKALCEGIDEMPAVDEDIAMQCETLYEERGLLWLQREVQEQDIEFYEQAEIDNPRRLLRALIFKLSTGQSILDYRNAQAKDRPFAIEYFVVDIPREELYERINTRVVQMFAQGQLAEAKELYEYRHNKNLETVGYSECFEFFDGHGSIEDVIAKVQQHTRHYAKRQVTWFKKMYPQGFMAQEDILKAATKFTR
ncbi:MAG: hypothetical protein RL660_492 [Bacteroidota bacterium]|jgi:tRNA dimethylallyltransferase